MEHHLSWHLSTFEGFDQSILTPSHPYHKLNIFTLERQKNELNIRMATTRPIDVQVAQLNSQGIKSIWSGLGWELLYLTNDDDGKGNGVRLKWSKKYFEV